MYLFLKQYQNIFIIFLLFLNLIPFVGWGAGHIASESLAYFYWGECALFGAFTLLMYSKQLIAFFIIPSLVIFLFAASGYAFENVLTIKMIVTFWCVYFLCWLCYLEIVKSQYGQNIRRQHPVLQFVYYLVCLAVSMTASLFVTLFAYGQWQMLDVILEHYILFLSVTVGIPSFAIGLLKAIDMIGSRHFLQLLCGTYHTPVEKERIVLFLDMVGSSAIAEKLGPKKSLSAIAFFIFDTSAIFRRFGGDIINYTGDGLVIIWPRKQADRVFLAIQKLKESFYEHRLSYKEKFGFVPDFRIGVHAGPVVIGQIGEEKLFLGLYGDVVNTAARLEQMNKALGTKVLLSRTIANELNTANQSLLTPKGIHEVRGKNEQIEVFALEKQG